MKRSPLVTASSPSREPRDRKNLAPALPPKIPRKPNRSSNGWRRRSVEWLTSATLSSPGTLIMYSSQSRKAVRASRVMNNGKEQKKDSRSTQQQPADSSEIKVLSIKWHYYTPRSLVSDELKHKLNWRCQSPSASAQAPAAQWPL